MRQKAKLTTETEVQMRTIYALDERGIPHVACEGSDATGEMIYKDGKDTMARIYLVAGQVFSARRGRRLYIIRWDGKAFTATCKAA